MPRPCTAQPDADLSAPRRRFAALFALAALALAAGPAGAAAPLELEWSAPLGCPDRTAIATEVARLLAGGEGRGGGSTLRARATVARRGAAFTVRIQTDLRGVGGERSLEGDTCAAVASATALILAMALDPDAVRGTASPTPGVQARPDLVAASGPPEAGPRVRLGAGLVGGAGSLPGLGFGLGLEVRGRVSDRLGLAALGQYWPSRDARTDEEPNAGGRFSYVGLGLGACHLTEWATVGLRLCLGPELARVSAGGFGVSDPGRGSGAWIAAASTAGISFRATPRLAFEVALAGAAPLTRPTFVLEGVGRVWQPATLSGRLLFGASWAAF